MILIQIGIGDTYLEILRRIIQHLVRLLFNQLPKLIDIHHRRKPSFHIGIADLDHGPAGIIVFNSGSDIVMLQNEFPDRILIFKVHCGKRHTVSYHQRHGIVHPHYLFFCSSSCHSHHSGHLLLCRLRIRDQFSCFVVIPVIKDHSLRVRKNDTSHIVLLQKCHIVLNYCISVCQQLLNPVCFTMQKECRLIGLICIGHVNHPSHPPGLFCHDHHIFSLDPRICYSLLHSRSQVFPGCFPRTSFQSKFLIQAIDQNTAGTFDILHALCQFLNLFPLRPAGQISETVISCVNPILAKKPGCNTVGTTLGLQFFILSRLI